MLDWLHWGGQLIISGPESLEALRDSFLADYLPAESERTLGVQFQSIPAACTDRESTVCPKASPARVAVSKELKG